MTGVGRVIRFQTATGPVVRSHGIELRFDTDLGDESKYFDLRRQSEHSDWLRT